MEYKSLLLIAMLSVNCISFAQKEVKKTCTTDNEFLDLFACIITAHNENERCKLSPDGCKEKSTNQACKNLLLLKKQADRKK